MTFRTTSLRILPIMVIGGAMMCGSVGAFPTWMGVYGSFERHSGGNPGVFTILMNQDYYGLHAEVGVQVDSGAWTTYAMTYVQNVDGNSVWNYTPAAAYPAGATVAYYFHGWDDYAGGDIYDSNAGLNYTFVAESPNVCGATFTNLTTLQTDYSGAYRAEDMVYKGSWLHVVSAVNNAVFVKRFDAQTLSPSLGWTLIEDPAAATIYEVGIAANASVIIVTYPLDDTLFIRRSTNDGESAYDNGSPFYPQIVIEEGSLVREVAIAHKGTAEFVIACSTGSGFGIEKVWTVRSTDNGETWAAPLLVDQAPEYANFNSGLWLGMNDAGYYLVYPYRPTGYDGYLRVNVSADAQSWSATDLMSDRAMANLGLLVTPTTAFAYYEPYYNNVTRIWRTAPTGWELVEVPHDYDDTQPVFLAANQYEQLLLVRGSDSGFTYQTSCTWGTSWSDATLVPAAPTTGRTSRIRPFGKDYQILRGSESLPTLQTACATFGTLGDVNNDGSFSAGDAQLAFAIALSSATYTADELWRADGNQDGSVSAGDAQCIFQEALGLPNSCFP